MKLDQWHNRIKHINLATWHRAEDWIKANQKNFSDTLHTAYHPQDGWVVYSEIKPKVIVVVEGGVIQEILSNVHDVEVLIKDSDTEGVPLDEIMLIDGKEYYKRSPEIAEYSPKIVEENFDQVEKQI